MITRHLNGALQLRRLTLKQPYAYFMFDLPLEYRKDVENRSRSITSEMGPMLISTSARIESVYYDEACEAALKRGVPSSLLPAMAALELGVIYGALRLKHALPRTEVFGPSHRWKFPGQVGYLTEDATRLPPRPHRGTQTLQLVTLTDEELALLRGARLLP